MQTVAWRAGLRQGDFISRVNDVNVSRGSCESVVKMIKQSRFKLVLEICRDTNNAAVAPVAARNRLEIVPEEEEEENEEEGEVEEVDEEDVEEEEDDEEEEEDVVEGQDDFARMYASLRYVDSVISSNENGEMLLENEEDDVDRLRRAAVQYVGHVVGAGGVRNAQIRCLHHHHHHNHHNNQPQKYANGCNPNI